jgi:glycosyltransferase involved in cell wall biosynthesis
MQKLVSVIIPCYNDYLYINKAIDSINKQDYKNLEIIIIDDGSNEKTKKVLREIIQPNLKLITQNNSGPSVARNVGIDQAQGEYILTLDADDYFEPSFIIKAVKLLNSDLKIGMVSCWGKVFNENGFESEFKPTGGGTDEVLFSSNTFAIGNLLFRKKCWQRVGGYDENMKLGYEDWEFNISVTKEGWGVSIIKEYLFNYRNKLDSRNSMANRHHKLELKLYIYRKHRDVCVSKIDLFINYFIKELQEIEESNINLRKTKEFKLGKLILKPLRIVKRIFR